MDAREVMKALDGSLTDEKVIEDMSKIIRNDLGGREIEIDTVKVSIPKDAKVEIIAKAFFKEYFEIDFGTGYRAKIAIGGVHEIKNGLVVAKYCFASLYYNDKGDLITFDLYTDY